MTIIVIMITILGFVALPQNKRRLSRPRPEARRPSVLPPSSSFYRLLILFRCYIYYSLYSSDSFFCTIYFGPSSKQSFIYIYIYIYICISRFRFSFYYSLYSSDSFCCTIYFGPSSAQYFRAARCRCISAPEGAEGAGRP